MQSGPPLPRGATAALRAGINWLIDHPAERQAMATRGREECREAFSAAHMVEELETVYAKALALAAAH